MAPIPGITSDISKKLAHLINWSYSTYRLGNLLKEKTKLIAKKDKAAELLPIMHFSSQLSANVKLNTTWSHYLQGVPKKVSVKPIFEFQTSGWVFLGVKNNSKNFGNKKNSRLLSKIWSKWALFVWKMRKILWFYQFMTMFRMENSF